MTLIMAAVCLSVPEPPYCTCLLITVHVTDYKNNHYNYYQECKQLNVSFLFIPCISNLTL